MEKKEEDEENGRDETAKKGRGVQKDEQEAEEVEVVKKARKKKEMESCVQEEIKEVNAENSD